MSAIIGERLIGLKEINYDSGYFVITLVRILCLSALKAADIMALPSYLTLRDNPYLHKLIEKSGAAITAVFRYSEAHSCGTISTGYLVVIEGKPANNTVGTEIAFEDMPQNICDAYKNCTFIAFSEAELEEFCNSKTVLYNPKTAEFVLEVVKGRTGYSIFVRDNIETPVPIGHASVIGSAIISKPVVNIAVTKTQSAPVSVKPAKMTVQQAVARALGGKYGERRELSNNLLTIAESVTSNVPILHVPIITGSKQNVAYLCAPCQYIKRKRECNAGDNCSNFSCYKHSPEQIVAKLDKLIADKNNKFASTLAPIFEILRGFWMIKSRVKTHGDTLPPAEVMTNALVESLHYVKPEIIGISKKPNSDSEQSESWSESS